MYSDLRRLIILTEAICTEIDICYVVRMFRPAATEAGVSAIFAAVNSAV